MSAELSSLDRLMGGVRKATKEVKFKVRKRKEEEQKKGKTAEKTEEKPTKETTESKTEDKDSDKGKKAYQPMLPGMRGTVERVAKKREPKAPEAPTSKVAAFQMSLPGMSEAAIRSGSASDKEDKDQLVIYGTDTASLPPVNLDSPMRGRQFNG